MARRFSLALLAAAALFAALTTFRTLDGRAPNAKPEFSLPFGLQGDGKADDTEALQKAVDAGTGAIHLSKGNYRITRPIVVDLAKVGPTSFTGDGTATIVMAGPGPALRFVGSHGGTADPKTLRAGVWEKERTPLVEGIEIAGGHEEADGIEADGTIQLTVSRTVIRQVRHGIHLVKRNRNVLVSACHIYQNRGIGIWYDQVNLHQSNIVGCHISYCGGGGIVSRGGDVRNVQIGTCDIESNMSPDGAPTANILLDCTGGSIAEVAIVGCTIQHNDKGTDSANIRILGKGKPIAKRPEAAHWGHITIGSNVLSDVQHNIDIENARGVTITNNTFWMAYQYNLRVRDSQQIVVGPNAFERNPGYNYGTSLQCKNALLFQNCRDCTLTGLHIHEVSRSQAGLVVENCRRFNVSSCTILDCEPVGLLWKNVADSRLSDCLIRNDLAGAAKTPPLQVIGGKGNMFANNLFDRAVEIPKASGVSQGNRQPEDE